MLLDVCSVAIRLIQRELFMLEEYGIRQNILCFLLIRITLFQYVMMSILMMISRGYSLNS